jgi:hypothetical protein
MTDRSESGKKTSKVYIGIDPGIHGGLAAMEYTCESREESLTSLATHVARVSAMPGTETDIWEWLVPYSPDYLAQRGATSYAIIEHVGGFMGAYDGDDGGPLGSEKSIAGDTTASRRHKRNVASAHTMFTFGKSYGLIRMALIAAGIPFSEVPPKRWQKGLHIPGKSKGESRTQFKNRLKAKAQQLFPWLPLRSHGGVTLSTCDALLLAEYCKRSCEGTLSGM